MVASPPLLSASASSSSSAVASTDCKACPRAALSTALEEHEDASRALAVVRRYRDGCTLHGPSLAPLAVPFKS